MSFFKELAELTEGMNITLRVNTKDGKMALLVLPDSLKTVQPLQLSGTAEELDAGFFDAVRQPLTDTKKLLHNQEQYVEGLQQEIKDNEKEAVSKSKSATPAKAAVKPAKKPEKASAKAKPEKKAPVVSKAAPAQKEDTPPPPAGPVQLEIG